MSYKFFSSVGVGPNPIYNGAKESIDLRVCYRFQPQKALFQVLKD